MNFLFMLCGMGLMAIVNHYTSKERNKRNEDLESERLKLQGILNETLVREKKLKADLEEQKRMNKLHYAHEKILKTRIEIAEKELKELKKTKSDC